jgi:hypothetical protein
VLIPPNEVGLQQLVPCDLTKGPPGIFGDTARGVVFNDGQGGLITLSDRNMQHMPRASFFIEYMATNELLLRLRAYREELVA